MTLPTSTHVRLIGLVNTLDQQRDHIPKADRMRYTKVRAQVLRGDAVVILQERWLIEMIKVSATH